MLATAMLCAVLLQAGEFRVIESFWGDLAYHRGVAYSMVGGTIHGAAPVAEIPSYYGGLFPLGIGWLSAAVGASFDATLSVVSWIASISIPLAFYAFARRAWPLDHVRAGVLALLSVLATGISGAIDHGWVNGLLPGSSNVWPLYPRDVAIVLLVAAMAATSGRHTVTSRGAILAGFLVGASLTVHVQLGVYSAIVLIAWVVTRRSARSRLLAPLQLVAVAAIVSSWWWMPRLVWALEHGPIDLESRPGIAPSLVDVLLSFGWVLVLVPISAMLHRRYEGDSFFWWWLLALTPLIVFSTLAPDVGFITLRRALFFVGLPLVILASASLSWLVQRNRLAFGLVVLAMFGTAAFEARAAYAFIDEQWHSDRYAFETYPSRGWSNVIGTLRSDVRRNGTQSVLVGDPDGLYLWSHTGASPYSLWLPGFVKIGFDVRSFTGQGLGTRVRELNQAFQDGITGLCRLGRRLGTDAIVLRTDGEGVGTYDLRPSGEYRSDDPPTDAGDVRYSVADGIVYWARNRQEVLLVRPGVELEIELGGSAASDVEVHAVARQSGSLGTGTLTVDGVSRTVDGRADGRSLVYRFDDVDLRQATEVTFSGSRNTEVTRVLGFQELPGSADLVAGGAVLFRPTELCR